MLKVALQTGHLQQMWHHHCFENFTPACVF